MVRTILGVFAFLCSIGALAQSGSFAVERQQGVWAEPGLTAFEPDAAERGVFYRIREGCVTLGLSEPECDLLVHKLLNDECDEGYLQNGIFLRTTGRRDGEDFLSTVLEVDFPYTTQDDRRRALFCTDVRDGWEISYLFACGNYNIAPLPLSSIVWEREELIIIPERCVSLPSARSGIATDGQLFEAFSFDQCDADFTVRSFLWDGDTGPTYFGTREVCY